jgi:hypothetical protein
MAITGSQRAYSMAQGGVMRGGSSRGNVHSMQTFVAIAGVQYAAARAVDAQQVDNDTLTITETEGQTPNTCWFRVRGFQPTDGQDVVITMGSINNLDRTFAGTILSDTHGYVGSPANGNDAVNLVDYTWQLTRDTITQRWTNESGTVIAKAIIAHANRGFTSLLVEAGLPTLDEFTVTNQTHAAALGALCARMGATWKATYRKDVRLGLNADPSQTDPTILTAASALLTEMKEFSVSRDLSQVITRQPVEGGGVNALASVAIGETILPVQDVAWYNPGGGTVASGPQRVTYGGTQAGGGGTLVGPGATPAAAPAVALAQGTGLGVGVYLYAYTDVTAAGESLPSPLATVTTLAGSAATSTVVARPGPSSAPTLSVGNPYTPPQICTSRTHNIAVAFLYDDGGLSNVGASSGLVTIPANTQFAFSNVALGGTGVTKRRVYHVGGTGSGGAHHLDDNTTTSGHSSDFNDFPFGDTTPSNEGTAIGGATIYVADITGFPASGNLLIGGVVIAYTGTQVLSGTIGRFTGCTGVTGTIAVGATVTVPTFQRTALTAIAIGASPTTSRKVYRTPVGAAQLKLLTTLADNTTTTFADSTADGSLGANAPTSDTSGLTQPNGYVLAGATTLLVAGASAFVSTGGWAFIGNGQQVIRYAGITGNTLTGVPTAGPGAIVATISYNSTVTAAPALTGIPASGVGSILYTIKQGDPVNLRVVVDDLAAQAALALLMLPLVDDGVIEGALIQDGRISETEARARGTAQIALRSPLEVSVGYVTHDKNTHAGRTIGVNLAAPTSVTASFKLQQVTITNFLPARWPTYQAAGSSTRFTLEKLLSLARTA